METPYQIKALKELIKNNKITQKEIALKSEINEKNISQILNGKNDPTLKTFNKIVNAVTEINTKKQHNEKAQ